MMRGWTFFWCVAAAIVCGSAWAQEVQVHAQARPQQAYLGSSIEYTVSVVATGHQSIQTPEIDLPAGLRLLGTSTSFESRDGPVRQPDGTYQLQRVLRRSFIYTVSADRSGEITIPPAVVMIDGAAVSSEPVTVTIREPQPMDGFSLEARLSRTRVYAGEPFTLYLTWFVGADVQEFALIGSELPDFVEAEAISPPAADRDRTGRYPTTAVYGQRISGTRGEATVNGERVLTVTFEIRYRCNEPGRLDLGPMAMLFNAESGRGVVRGVARVESIPVEILPLPREGRPAGFSGLIGAYEVAADAAPTTVNVGDPITLTVRITGPDAARVGEGPDLAASDAFASGFKLDPGGWERQAGSSSEAVFETTIRALGTEVEVIPPVRLPYFDTAAGSYRLAESEAIPLEVRPSRVVTLEDAVVSSSLLPPMAREALGSPRQGLWAIAPDEIGRPWGGESAAWWWLIAAPPALWLTMAVRDAWRARARGPAAVRRRAYRRAVRLARRGEAEAAVRVFMGDLLGQVPETVTAADCQRSIADAAAADRLCAWLAADEAARFGREQANRPDPRGVASVLRDLHLSRGGIRS